MRKRSSFNLKELDLDPVSSRLFWCVKQLQTAQTHSGLFLWVLNKDKPHRGQFFKQLICNKTHEFLHLLDPQYDTERQQKVKGPLNVLRVLCGFTLTGWLIYLSSGVGGGDFTAESNSLLWSSGRHKQRVFVFYLPPGMMESPAQKNERTGREKNGRIPFWFFCVDFLFFSAGALTRVISLSSFPVEFCVKSL